MSATDLAIISIVSVLAFGFMTIGIAFWGIWVGMRNELREMRAEHREDARATSARVSDVELEQARMQGIMSVIQPQARAHNAPPSADSNPPTDDD